MFVAIRDYVINGLGFSKQVLYKVWFVVLVENNSQLKTVAIFGAFFIFIF